MNLMAHISGTVADVSNFQYFFAIAVFLVAYAIIISEKINRAIIALIGAALMVIIGVMDLETAFFTR